MAKNRRQQRAPTTKDAETHRAAKQARKAKRKLDRKKRRRGR